MKKKTLMAILPLCVAMAMTACGGNADTAEVKETTKVEATTATEESAEAGTPAEAEDEASTGDEESVESDQTGEDASENEESSEEIENGADDSAVGQEFPIIDQAVLDQDKSEEYGVNSISCYDLDQYLDENGDLQADISSDESYYEEYSGRWAYPEITPCRFFGELTMTSRVDQSSSYTAVDSETGEKLSFIILSGKYMYNGARDQVGHEFESGQINRYDIPFAIQNVDGEQDVINECMEMTLESDEVFRINSYYFAVGNFTVIVQSGTELTQEDVQLIADNISLTDGTEQ